MLLAAAVGSRLAVGSRVVFFKIGFWLGPVLLAVAVGSMVAVGSQVLFFKIGFWLGLCCWLSLWAPRTLWARGEYFSK